MLLGLDPLGADDDLRFAGDVASVPRVSSSYASRATRQRSGGADDSRLHQIGDAEKVGDEERLGVLVHVLCAPTCSMCPPFITARRSDIVSASSWSCVT